MVNSFFFFCFLAFFLLFFVGKMCLFVGSKNLIFFFGSVNFVGRLLLTFLVKKFKIFRPVSEEGTPFFRFISFSHFFRPLFFHPFSDFSFSFSFSFSSFCFFFFFFFFSLDLVLLFFLFFSCFSFFVFFFFQHLYQGLTKNVSSVVGAPWTCGVLTT